MRTRRISAATLRMVEDLDVSYLHVFPYSDREGARASAFEGKVAEGVKRRRAKPLKAADARKREPSCAAHVGKTVRIVPEMQGLPGQAHEGVFRQLPARLHPL